MSLTVSKEEEQKSCVIIQSNNIGVVLRRNMKERYGLNPLNLRLSETVVLVGSLEAHYFS